MLTKIEQQNFDVLVDLMYANTSNIFGKKFYPHTATCMLHTDAALCLKRAAQLVTPLGLRIKILDAYRPQTVQQHMWDMVPNGNYLADPKIGSNHSRGVALDVTLVDRNQCELNFGTPVDYMDKRSHHFNSDIITQGYHNRLILLSIMVGAGFKYIDNEWWHYELKNAKDYPLLDLSL